MKTMESVCVGQKKFRPGLTSGSFYQPPVPRMPPIRPQSEYGVSGLPWMTTGYSRGSSGSGSAEWPPWSTRPSSNNSRRSRACSVLLAAGALVALLVVLAVAALALYMGAFRTDSSDAVIVFEGRLRVRRAIGAGTPVGAPGAARLTTAIRQAYVGSPLASALTSTEVHAINNDKLVVFFRLYLDRRKIPNTVDNLEETIRNILVEDSLLKKSALRQLNVDPMSIAIRRDADQTHRTESQTGSHTESKPPAPPIPVMPQNAKEKILQTRMGVIRKPAVIQTNVTSSHKVKTPIVNDEPEINEDDLPVIQGSFQITKTDADITENKHHREFTKSVSRPAAPPKEITTESHRSKPTRMTQINRKNTTEMKNKTITSPITPRTTIAATQKTTTTPTTTTTTTTTVASTRATHKTTIPSKTESSTLDSKENLPDYLPKLDTLFAVPVYADQEPWRPIRPGEAFSTDNNSSFLEAEDRLGETELVEDLSSLEGIANVEEVPQLNEQMKHNQNVVPYQGIWPSYTEYPPEPVYTSFTDTAFSSTYKDAQTLGINYPRPHPIPVDKLSDGVAQIQNSAEVSHDSFYTDSQTNTNDSNNNSSYTPPKDTLSTVAINVRPLKDDENTEIVNLEGGVIIRKQNHSNIAVEKDEEISADTVVKAQTVNTSYEGPVLYTPLNKWEFVNGSTNEPANLKKIPNKTFNETLQAVITQNNDPKLRDNKFDEKIDGYVNITKIFDELVSKLNDSKISEANKQLPERSEEVKKDPQPIIYALGSSEPVDSKTQEMLMKEMMIQEIRSSTLLPTLLPVKSNSGIGRPLRPRPKVPVTTNNDNGEDRSFSQTNTFPFISEVKSFINNLRTDHSLSDYTQNFMFNATEATPSKNKHSKPSEDFERPMNDMPQPIKEPTRELTKKIDISEKFRLPKTHPSDTTSIKTNIENHFLELMAQNKSYVVPTATEFFLTHPSTQAIALTEKVKLLLRDFEKSQNQNRTTISPYVVIDDLNFRNKSLITEDETTKPNVSPKEDKNDVLVKVHVESSVSSSSEKSTDLPVNKTSSNNISSDETIAEKLKQLANIATISDVHNTTFFKNENIPDETVISTKAVSSSYTINGAGFKILTKTFNKIPGNFKDDDKKKNKIVDDTPLQSHLETVQDFKDIDDCVSKNLTVTCSNGQCLPETSRCNRLLDCPDGEDEKGCTCADYLRSQFLLRKLCDGVLDCWDFSDENNCEWCKPDQYVCSNSRQCIDKDKICDGHKDCPLGDDEKQCVTVATSQEDASSYPYSKEGYIMVQKHGKWGRLCIQNFDKVVARSHSSLQITDLGRAVCRSMTYNDYQNVDRVVEDRANKDNQYFSLHYTSKADGGRGGLAFRKSGCSRGQVAKVTCSQLQCGARPQAAAQQARIVGGGNAGAGSWPWQAALYKEGDFQCGATLISDRWLISAGHCFYHAQEDFWVARLGTLRRGTTFPSPYEQLQPISSVILHPGYIDSGFINDIALLKTAYPVAFSDYVRPICLPPSETEMEDGRRCTVVGWGQLFEVGRIFPDTLQEVELPVISTSECRKRTLFLPLYRITEDMFCAGFDRGGRDACLGDSGGPLMCQEQDNQWYLYGVTSNGYGCARANRPGVYTKVSNYVNWIQTTMKLFDDRSFDIVNNVSFRKKNTTYSDLEVSESRSSQHRHVDKCRGHRCPLGECLPPTRVCNGFMECSDGSDESNCR